MYAEVGTHAVACAMQVVKAGAPQRLTRNGVNLGARSAFREDGGLKSQVSLQHKSVNLTLERRERSEGYRPRDVRSAVQVLRAAV